MTLLSLYMQGIQRRFQRSRYEPFSVRGYFGKGPKSYMAGEQILEVEPRKRHSDRLLHYFTLSVKWISVGGVILNETSGTQYPASIETIPAFLCGVILRAFGSLYPETTLPVFPFDALSRHSQFCQNHCIDFLGGSSGGEMILAPLRTEASETEVRRL